MKENVNDFKKYLHEFSNKMPPTCSSFIEAAENEINSLYEKNNDDQDTISKQ